ncbi:MAG: helix-turn-helix transcriptional regulator [Calditrichae bacterium]|nr:helix-turn-helix transcriptional regulator [Calditrichota bacterium]MCB9057124.1 helix-turn-helix transcriptional regulator [Calditrichia bacterium]
MSAILVYYENDGQLPELQDVFNEFKNHPVCYEKEDYDKFLQMEQFIIEEEIDIFICATAFSKRLIKNLYYLYAHNPLLTIIYFNPILKNNEFSEFYRAGVSYCFVGEKRQINMHDALNKLVNNHWKKIPADLLPSNSAGLPERSVKILHFIENTSLKKCNAENLAEYLNISQSHFRKEFRHYFGLNFREFKQRLIQHYEDVLLFERNMKPGHIYKILDYKNLSAFSRSFKIRHGVSWQNLIKTKD